LSDSNNDSIHEDTTTGLNNRKLLMWAFLGSDCMFFASLIATYLVYKGKSVTGPNPIDLFSIPVTSVSTFVLLMSSMSMVLAYSALTRGRLKVFRVWLLSTVILGMTFLGFQVFEFRDFTVNEVKISCEQNSPKYLELENKLSNSQKSEYKKQCSENLESAHIEFGMTPRTNLFGTTFFVLTGFHGAHVTIGVIWLLSLYFYSFKRGAVSAERHLDVDLAALYWHFVDIVWIIIFTVVYLFGVYEGF